MSEGLIGVIIGGILGSATNIITMLYNGWKDSINWKKEKKGESLTKILYYAYRLKNKGSSPMYDNPKGKHLGPNELKELFDETATLKYWMATAQIYCSPTNRNTLDSLRKDLDQSYTAFHSFHTQLNVADPVNDIEVPLDQKLINRIIEIANNEL